MFIKVYKQKDSLKKRERDFPGDPVHEGSGEIPQKKGGKVVSRWGGGPCRPRGEYPGRRDSL